jgi:hypothetical protein
VVLAEALDLVQRERVAREMEPRVDEHGSVAGGQDEAVAVDPLGVIRVVLQQLAVQHGAHLRGAQGQAQVARVRRRDGVHGQATGLICGLVREGERGRIFGHEREKIRIRSLTDAFPQAWTASPSAHGASLPACIHTLTLPRSLAVTAFSATADIIVVMRALLVG